MCTLAITPAPCCELVCRLVQAAIINYEHGPNKPRSSWDPLTTLVAVNLFNTGDAMAAPGIRLCSNCDGKNHVDPHTGDNTWVPGPPSNQT